MSTTGISKRNSDVPASPTFTNKLSHIIASKISEKSNHSHTMGATSITKNKIENDTKSHGRSKQIKVKTDPTSTVPKVHESRSDQSVTSQDTNTTTSKASVYVKDAVYIWLPAQVQSYEDDEYANVEVILPNDWAQTTVFADGSSIKELEHAAGSKGDGDNKFSFSPFGSDKKSTNDASVSFSNSRNSNSRANRIVYDYERQYATSYSKGTPKGIIRRVRLDDYIQKELPLQNLERHQRRSSFSSSHHRKSKSPLSLINARDISDLPYLHEAAILYNLKLRHANKCPYTRVGDIMVAVNPFQWINGLYNVDKQNLYAKHLIWDTQAPKGPDTNSDNKSDRFDDDHSEISSKSTLTETSAATTMTESGNGIDPQSYSKLGLEPHVYETASLAYKGLAFNQKNQTILVTGESGAGKTETVKIVMTNLATLEKTRPYYYSSQQWQGSTAGLSAAADVVKRVLKSNPVFEAFGNAKTVRNDNSSRFGRFTLLQFDVENRFEAQMHGRIVPGCILAGNYCDTYLLEKSRVVSHAAAERNYHIFYQLLAAPETEKVAIWEGLANTSNQSFRYIGDTDTTSIEGKSDADNWTQTVEALKIFGFEGKDFRELMQCLCVTLQLGNLSFECLTGDNGGSQITSIEELTKLSKLMGIPKERIIESMTQRKNVIRGEEVMVRLNSSDAKDGCDALAKEIYARTFETLVSKINNHTSAENLRGNKETKPFGTIGLLDIFGFERFDENRFEQICINYANERLQQRYVLDNFRSVQAEYVAEGIDVFDFSIVDNSDVVYLLEGKHGLISCLNEECIRPNGSHTQFVARSKQLHLDGKRLLSDRLHQPFEFGVKHYAGPVTYDARKFLQSNSDLIPTDLLECAGLSSIPMIQREFTDLADITRQLKGNTPRLSNVANKRTVIGKFSSQLNTLMDEIVDTKTRYIRCIKPNSLKKPLITNHRETMNQVVCAGLVTAITISRETFPNNLPYDLVWERFECIYLNELKKQSDHVIESPKGTGSKSNTPRSPKRKGTLRQRVEALLKILLTNLFTRADGARVPCYACGTTKVYFRTGALEQLESDRLEYFSATSTVIQTWVRRHVQQRKYIACRNSIIRVQALQRGRQTRVQFRKDKLSVIILQCLWRQRTAIKLLLQLRQYKASTIIQSNWRGYKERCHYITSKQKAVKIEACTRCWLVKNKYRRFCQATISLQSLFRSKQARHIYHEQKRSIIIIQKFIRRILFRFYLAKYRQEKMDNAIVTLQTWFRWSLAYRRYIIQKAAAIHIQNFWRRISSIMLSLKLKQEKRDQAAVLIQSSYRGFEKRRVYVADKAAAILIQNFWRRILSLIILSKLKQDKRDQAAVTIAAFYRSAKCRQSFIKKKIASVTIQKYWRRMAAIFTKSKLLLERREQASVIIQSSYRCFEKRRLYVVILGAVEVIQKFCRKAILSIQQTRKIVNTSATLIQTRWRGYHIRMMVEKEIKSATIIQTRWRCFYTRRNYIVMLHLNRINESISDVAVVTIQSCWRYKTQRCKYLQKRSAAIKLQRFFRWRLLSKSSLHQEVISLRKHNALLMSEAYDLKEDKLGLVDHAQSLEEKVKQLNTQVDMLSTTHIFLINELKEREQKNTMLFRRLQTLEKKEQVQSKGTRHSSIPSKPYHNNNSKYVQDSTSRKQNISNFATESLQEKLEREREEHAKEVRSLKEQIQKHHDEHKGYMDKLTDALETMYAEREASTKRLKKQLKAVKKEKEAEIESLRRDVKRLRAISGNRKKLYSA